MVSADHGGDDHKLELWDCAGKEHFRCLTRSYYNRANVVLLTFALDNLSSFHSLQG